MPRTSLTGRYIVFAEFGVRHYVFQKCRVATIHPNISRRFSAPSLMRCRVEKVSRYAGFNRDGQRTAAAR